jgi:hypothetical protein
VVNPKLTALRLQESRLLIAEAELRAQTERLQQCKLALDALQALFEAKLVEKARIERSAAATRRKMEQVRVCVLGW